MRIGAAMVGWRERRGREVVCFFGIVGGVSVPQ
jgi:hypothetical protein